eukprot:CAMPEP_0205824308 /NCGR_PEP_ID=MMETSP0206-20130828/20320_1 /ASSEMBLY_ACC=CAM_ASM_000279 /TAXON_ID=36767 /ORGANISM="Euplotes focardii, Strain TN1" /LENGTH=321 /DNA_ID=CAMNT_0053122309 /DNA_START=11 /DNA_END=976 /DNA_ORIENTATION=+
MQSSPMADKPKSSKKQQHFKCKVRDDQEVGRWKKSEHQDFLKGLSLYGKDWKKIEALIGTRNGAQIRSHAQKYFSKVTKTLETRSFDKNSRNSDDLEILKEVEILQKKESELNLNYKPLEQAFTQPPQHNLKTEKKYSEEDIQLLIKFIVKEFSKIIQKWFFTQPSPTPSFSMNSQPTGSNNLLLLNLLLNKENVLRQQQESFTQNLLQQANPKLILDMLEQFKHLSGTSTPQTSNAVVPTLQQCDPEPKENLDDIKSPERDDSEIKDEVNTVQSSEGRTDRKRSISEETSQNRKISLEQAQSLLSQHAFLQPLFKNFSSK